MGAPSRPRRRRGRATTAAIVAALALLGLAACEAADNRPGPPEDAPVDHAVDAASSPRDATFSPRDAAVSPPDADRAADLGAEAVADIGAPPHGLAPAALALALEMHIGGPPPPDSTNRLADDDAAAALGQRVFFDATLSPRGLSCAFCHPPARAFSGALSYDGYGGLDFRSVPALVGSAWQRWFFWDGRADSAWAQFIVPFEKHDELSGSRVGLVHALSEDPTYAAAYTMLFGPLPDTATLPREGKPTTRSSERAQALAWEALAAETQRAVNRVIANIGKAVAAYERRLVSGTSPFDAFLEALRVGDTDGLADYPESARRGLALFVGRARCAVCHSGPALSDGAFHNLGLAPPDPRVPIDEGRAAGAAHALADPFNAAGEFSDDPAGPGALRLTTLAATPAPSGAFRTPTLRNVALTGPYLHDGRLETLEQVIRFKADANGTPAAGERDPAFQPVALTDDDVRDLVAFLTSLTDGPLPRALVTAPR